MPLEQPTEWLDITSDVDKYFYEIGEKEYHWNDLYIAGEYKLLEMVYKAGGLHVKIGHLTNEQLDEIMETGRALSALKRANAT